MLLVVAGSKLHAQYDFLYSVFANYTPGGNGSPFSDLLCSGQTSSINYDNNPNTTNPKISTDLCPAVGAQGINFGAQFSAFMFTWVPGNYTFYVGTDDGSSLFIDGVDVLDMPGTHSYESQTVSVFLGALSHTFLLDYYANDIDDFHGKAVQVMVDPGLNVSTYDESLLFHGTAEDVNSDPPLVTTPEPSAVLLLLTGFGAVVGVATLKRRRVTVA